ncbi:hypothetical protein E1B28_012606 [Marasmius oreades]|uniref:Septation initiation network scaffold protein cdc11 n=1 Tax=Marasmius oreades TaxID=181124 RepID=A0A9P7RRY2_9AGAR|nr:uncharacterized protein E1B28_012606 [Marasmius oreades]KAG7088634.1 hypothetical protein E1B28_012606 [Marasmius oreades]
MASSRPAWQTEELEDEWIDVEPSTNLDRDIDDDNDDYLNGSRSISLTAPLATIIHTTIHTNTNSPSISPSSSPPSSPSSSSTTSSRPAGGTFLVHASVANGPLLPKTPGRNKKANIKDFFSPLPLERMFEPPSPPSASPPLRPPPQYKSSPDSISNPVPIPSITTLQSNNSESDEILETDIPGMASFDGRKPSLACQFTFAAPRETWLNPNTSTLYPQAESTPGHLHLPHGEPPSSEPPLRLFQFQYDTFTRDHLSAMVDSIAVNTGPGSGTTNSPTSPNNVLSKVSELPSTNSDFSHLRSAKRLKLSPRSEYDDGRDGPRESTVTRPRIYGKDYVGASQSLMQAIKDARDFSTISTVVSVRRGDRDDDMERSKSENISRSWVKHDRSISPFIYAPTSEPHGGYSSSRFREQAATLMAQLKDDMRGQKRIFSGESEYSVINHQEASLNFGDGSETRPSDGTRQSLRMERPVPSHVPVLSISSSPSRTRSRSDSKQSTLRRLGAAHPTDAELSQRMSRMSVGGRRTSSSSTQPTQSVTNIAPISGQSLSTSAAPPSYPSSSVRHTTADDLNRFVSSSTASGTTLTSGSVPSFVKHPGPVQIRTIAPSDVPTLPERMGNMMFDKVLMKWVKSSATVTWPGDYLPTEEVSEDPFGDIESLRDDSKGHNSMDTAEENQEGDEQSVLMGHTELSRVEEQPEVEDEEEMILTSFETDDPSARIVDVMTGVEDDDARTTDSEAGQDELIADESSEVGEAAVVVIDTNYQSRTPSPPLDISASPSSVVPIANNISDTPNRSTILQPPSSIRSALKSTTVTPTSALKDTSLKYKTPLRQQKHRRSVSFSDGKREGPIRGLGRNADGDEDDEDVGDECNHTVPSARSKRIADMMAALEDSDSDSRIDESPSKGSSSEGVRPEELQPLTKRQPSSAPIHGESLASRSPRRVFSRSDAFKLPNNTGNRCNATFLTECSFGVAHDRLVQVITDIEPFEPHWEQLNAIDLSGKNIESAARLKEFLPKLDSLKLSVGIPFKQALHAERVPRRNNNLLSWLSGIPGTVRTLSVSSNSLTRLTSYHHLLNLENLDISGNEIESLSQLSCLRHLRELKADGNKITSTEGLEKMDGLVKLSLQGNHIRSIELERHRWSHLEMLNLSINRLDSISELASLTSLIVLNLDNNSLETIDFGGNMPRLRILRASGNRLSVLNASRVANLRTLYLDNNSLTQILRLERLTKLENLSVRNQGGRGCHFGGRDTRDVRRLYLSGNGLGPGFLSERCYNLVYLELAACRLTQLPEGLKDLIPNVRVLNLNYNFLEDVRPLEGLTRMAKLTVIGSRLKGTKAIIKILQQMPEVEMLDLRMNPCTLGWYLPLLVKDVPGALQPSEGTGGKKGNSGPAWQDLDSKFRRDLPNDSYIGRLAYRGLVMEACPKIRMLDGIEVTEKERDKAHKLLVGIIGKR